MVSEPGLSYWEKFKGKGEAQKHPEELSGQAASVPPQSQSLHKIDSERKTQQKKNPKYQTANHNQSSRLELCQRNKRRNVLSRYRHTHTHLAWAGVCSWAMPPSNRTRSRGSPCSGATPNPARI